jgi:hypothetical protein
MPLRVPHCFLLLLVTVPLAPSQLADLFVYNFNAGERLTYLITHEVVSSPEDEIRARGVANGTLIIECAQRRNANQALLRARLEGYSAASVDILESLERLNGRGFLVEFTCRGGRAVAVAPEPSGAALEAGPWPSRFDIERHAVVHLESELIGEREEAIMLRLVDELFVPLSRGLNVGWQTPVVGVPGWGLAFGAYLGGNKTGGSMDETPEDAVAPFTVELHLTTVAASVPEMLLRREGVAQVDHARGRLESVDSVSTVSVTGTGSSGEVSIRFTARLVEVERR